MKTSSFHSLGCAAILLVVLLSACTPTSPPNLPVTATQPLASQAPASPTAPQPSATAGPTATPDATQTALDYPLSQPGPYFTGKRSYSFVDESRGGRKVPVTVWYPAVKPEGYKGTTAKDAEPDMSAAPYPLLIMSTTMANTIAAYLVTHGFSIASVDGIDSSDVWDLWLVDYPLDLLYALDQTASGIQGLEGVVDAEHAGAMGYSFDSWDSLALGGARVDPQFYLDQCAQATTMNPVPAEWWIKYICTPAGKWDEFTTHAGEAITQTEDGLWQPMTDQRIRAVMPMAPEGAWILGERGLAAVDRPTLIIAAQNDQLNYYDLEAVPIYHGLGASDKSMITFLNQGHMMIFDSVMRKRMAHFAVAFFGYHLQGKQDYAQYFSQEFVAQRPELSWGAP
jgi:predicted dienelactone hydrolase